MFGLCVCVGLMWQVGECGASNEKMENMLCDICVCDLIGVIRAGVALTKHLMNAVLLCTFLRAAVARGSRLMPTHTKCPR